MRIWSNGEQAAASHPGLDVALMVAFVVVGPVRFVCNQSHLSRRNDYKLQDRGQREHFTAHQKASPTYSSWAKGVHATAQSPPSASKVDSATSGARVLSRKSAVSSLTLTYHTGRSHVGITKTALICETSGIVTIRAEAARGAKRRLHDPAAGWRLLLPPRYSRHAFSTCIPPPEL